MSAEGSTRAILAALGANLGIAVTKFVAYLLAAIVMEAFSLRTAVKESNAVRGRASWTQFVRRAKSPELPVVLLEDVGALLGLEPDLPRRDLPTDAARPGAGA